MVTQAGVQFLVHSGGMTDYALHYARQAAQMLPGFTTVLIADRQVTSIPNGVTVASMSNLISKAQMRELRERVEAAGFPHSFRGGYWVRVFSRFLAIRSYIEKRAPAGPCLQIETDVASFLSHEVVAVTLDGKSDRALVPMHDDVSVCPSIILAPTGESLASAMTLVVDRLGEGFGQSDMALLGRAVIEGGLGVLPTTPLNGASDIGVRRIEGSSISTDVEPARLVFDAAAIGQYHFGIDPRNNQGVIIPGYRELRGGIDPGRWDDWHLAVGRDNVVRVAARCDGKLMVFAILHVHAKLCVPAPVPENAAWQEWLSVANHERGATARVLPLVYVRTRVERARQLAGVARGQLWSGRGAKGV